MHDAAPTLECEKSCIDSRSSEQYLIAIWDSWHLVSETIDPRPTMCHLPPFPRPHRFHEDRVLGPQQCRVLAQATALQNCHLSMFELYGTQGHAVIAIIHLRPLN